MTFARVLQWQRLLQILLDDISRLGLQSEAVHLFDNFLDREDRRETEGAAAKQLHLGVLAVGKPGAAKQCREWLLPRTIKAAGKGVLTDVSTEYFQSWITTTCGQGRVSASRAQEGQLSPRQPASPPAQRR